MHVYICMSEMKERKDRESSPFPRPLFQRAWLTELLRVILLAAASFDDLLAKPGGGGTTPPGAAVDSVSNRIYSHII